MRSAIGRPRSLQTGETKRTTRLAIHPVEKDIASAYWLVSFEDAVTENTTGEPLSENASELDAKLNVRELEDELVMTRERLQTVIEELETSNEELQALNEEIQSSNEELQSSNEELEATNEELQSTNEELTTVNEELQIRTNELAEALNDMEKIQNSVGYPIIAISEELKILRFNTPAAALFSLNPSSLNQHIASFRLPLGMKKFSQQIQTALETGKIVEDNVPLQNVTMHCILRPMKP